MSTSFPWEVAAGMSRTGSYRQWRRHGFGTRFDAVRCDSDEEWREFRRLGIGGSDVAPIMGISPYRTALDVWLEKTGRDQGEEPASEAMYWGTVNEAAIARRFAEDHPDLRVSRVNATLVSRELPWAHANLDRMVVGPGGEASVLEVKTASSWKADDWADGVPAYYLTQVTLYLMVTGWRRAHVAVLIGGNDYREYEVARDEEDVRAVRDACADFWDNYVRADVMPKVVGADAATLAGMHRDPDGEVVAPPDMAEADRLIAAYQDAAERERRARADRADAQAALCQAIGDHRGLVTDVARVTWSRTRSRKFDSKRFRADHPDEWDAYQTEYDRNGGLRITEVR